MGDIPPRKIGGGGNPFFLENFENTPQPSEKQSFINYAYCLYHCLYRHTKPQVFTFLNSTQVQTLCVGFRKSWRLDIDFRCRHFKILGWMRNLLLKVTSVGYSWHRRIYTREIKSIFRSAKDAFLCNWSEILNTKVLLPSYY